MNQDKLDHQRKVVLDERSQTIENAPYGKEELLITAQMFPSPPLPQRGHRHTRGHRECSGARCQGLFRQLLRA